MATRLYSQNRSLIVGFALLLTNSLGYSAAEDEFDLLVVPAIIAATNVQKPGPGNTGPKGALTKQEGSISVTTDNTVIENIDLKGCIQVKANNVVIRNVRIDCSGFYAIQIMSGFENLTVEDTEMFGMKSSGVLGSNFTLRRVNIHDSGGDAVKPSTNVLIEDSWFHKLGTNVGSHSDGLQMVSGGNVTLRGSNIDMPATLAGYTNSQCMIIQTNNGPIDNVLIEKNWLNGGGWCVQVNDKSRGHGSPTNVIIRDNLFGPDCSFGTILVRGENTDTTISNNIFELTGEELGTQVSFDTCGNDF